MVEKCDRPYKIPANNHLLRLWNETGIQIATLSEVSQIILFCCFIAWNQRCSSRSPENHDRPAVQQGMWQFFSLDLIFASILCQLLHRPLRCPTDRRCVFLVPLCRPDISGGWDVNCFWTRHPLQTPNFALLFDSGHRCHRRTLRSDASAEVKSMYFS